MQLKPRQSPLPYPDVADTSAASAELVAFMEGYFAAKTRKDLEATMAYFSPALAAYADAILGLEGPGFEVVKGMLGQFMPNWPETAKSYPTRILGDMNSAIVGFTDTPELFGGELRALGSVDIKDGKIVRWVDHWDSRGWPNAYHFPKGTLSNYYVSEVGENASARMRNVAGQLAAAMAGGNATAAAALFTYDAVWEDMALRSQIEGQAAIERYLGRALARLPHGIGSALRHTVGSDRGGGFEWTGRAGSPATTGVTALTLDDTGLISRATSVYDGALFTFEQLQALAALTLEP